MTLEERRAYKLAWSRANRDRLAALRDSPERRATKAAYDKRRYQAKGGQIRATAARWYERNRQRAIARITAWVAENGAAVRHYKRTWKITNPAKARRLPVSGHATAEQVAARVAFYGGVCAYCGGPFQHIDHVIPLVRGGTGWPSNLRPACRHCNLSKHSKTMAEWAAYKEHSKR